MHSARLENSPRLKRVLDVLRDGQEHSTFDLIREARVAAVNSIIAELRDNGCIIECRQTRSGAGERIFLYRLTGITHDLLRRAASYSPPPSPNT